MPFQPINFMELQRQSQPDFGYRNDQQNQLLLALLDILQKQEQRQKEQEGKELPEDYLQYLLRKNDEEPYQPYYPRNPDEITAEASQNGISDLMSKLRQRESGGNYGIKNSLGYVGAYQFGAPALETVDFLKPGTGKLGNKALNNPANWKLAGGLKEYLSNPVIQDEAMRRLMNVNRKRLEGMGLINANTSPQDINGMLAAAHLAGPGGVRKMMRGGNPRDAYGTGAREYYNLGRGVI